MSSDIIHKVTLVRSTDGEFVEKTEYSSSNVWNYDNKSRPRNNSERRFEDSAKGHYAYYVWSISSGYHVDGGMMRGAGLSNLSGHKAFSRWINRGRKVGMELPRIADPLGTHSTYNGIEATSAPEFLRSTMLKAMDRRFKMAKNAKIVIPESFDHSLDFACWMRDNRISIFTVKVEGSSPSKPDVLRIFYQNGGTYKVPKGRRSRGYPFDGSQIQRFIGVEKIIRWLPEAEES